MRKTKRDWLYEGLMLLTEDGFTALTIDALTLRLEVTKGSFYHHFKSIHEYKEQMLLFYEQEGTLNVIEAVQHASSAREKLYQLREIIVSFPSRTESVMRAWALQDDMVRDVQARVDSQRLSFVRELCKALVSESQSSQNGGLQIADSSQAEAMAQLLFAMYVGARQMIPPIEGDALRQLFIEFQRVYSL
jgi:AcrR family transcriptional regulator